MTNSCWRSDAMVSQLGIACLLITAMLLVASFGVEAVQGGPADSQSVPSPYSPINQQQDVLLLGTSWTEYDNELQKVIVTLKNNSSQRVQYLGVRVRYKSKSGEPLGGRDHYIRKSIDPGQTIQVSLPESRHPDSDRNTSVTAQAIPQMVFYGHAPLVR